MQQNIRNALTRNSCGSMQTLKGIHSFSDFFRFPQRAKDLLSFQEAGVELHLTLFFSILGLRAFFASVNNNAAEHPQRADAQVLRLHANP